MNLEQKLNAYYEKYHLDYYDAVLGQEEDFSVWEELSVLRTNLLSWYPFDKKDEVLEVEAGYGSLTGFLCDRCAKVTVLNSKKEQCDYIAKRWSAKTNLNVKQNSGAVICSLEKYDYIIVTGYLEEVAEESNRYDSYISFLRRLSESLKANGKILLSVNNRFGIRYFSGAIDRHTGEAFGGICGYLDETQGRSFDRNELMEIMHQAGLPHLRFYYPLPDYRFPQMVYSDDYLPKENVRERLRPYYRRNDTLVANELALYDDISRNQVFPFFANSFLVEASLKKELNKDEGRPCFATMTADRKADRAYATVIYSNDKVFKKPLCQDGIRGCRQLLDHLADLAKYDIPVVEAHLTEDGSLEEPCVKLPTLSEYIKSIVYTDREGVYALLDRLQEYILKSGEYVDADANALREKYDCDDVEFGPILKRTYIELIPMNCFYDSDRGAFLFFDQEFVRTNYPAGYVMYRAVRYFYEHNTGVEKVYPKEEMMKRYHLTSAWDIYENEERLLQLDNCQLDKYESFYKFNAIDKERIRENHYQLESEIQQLQREAPTKSMLRTWQVEIDLLDEFNRICKKYGLTYFLCFGSLLGAVRHKGIIPWDDDVDVVMFREDYVKFLEIAPCELKNPYAITTLGNNPCGTFIPLIRFTNTKTTHIETADIGREGIHGIHIDIQPMDVYPSNEVDKVQLEKKLKKIMGYLWAYVYGRDFCGRKLDYLNILRQKVLVQVFGYQWFVRWLEKNMQKYAKAESNYIGIWPDYAGKIRRFEKKDFSEVVELEFEGKTYPAPAGYKNVLFQLYGADYMKLPPKKDREYHHDGFHNPDVPYEFYNKLLNGLFENIRGKQIIIFGAGMMLEDYMEKYGKRYRPSFIVDNDSGKWNHEAFGIDIRDPKSIKDIPEKKRQVIICSFHYREIMKQLDDMGICDYKVYIQHQQWIADSERKEYDR